MREDANLSFDELESASSSHLTVGPRATKSCHGCVGIQAMTNDDNSDGLKSWAKVSVIILSLMIGVLVLLFFSRRLWKRRRDVDVDKCEMLTKDFNVSVLDMIKEKDYCRDYVGDVKAEGDKDNSKKKQHEKKIKLDGSERSSSSRRSGRSERTSTSDTSGLTNSHHIDEEYLSDESEAARRRRRAKKKGKRKLQGGSNRSGTSDRSGMSSSLHEIAVDKSLESNGPPSLDDLRREMKKKRSSRRSNRNMDSYQIRQHIF